MKEELENQIKHYADELFVAFHNSIYVRHKGTMCVHRPTTDKFNKEHYYINDSLSHEDYIQIIDRIKDDINVIKFKVEIETYEGRLLGDVSPQNMYPKSLYKYEPKMEKDKIVLTYIKGFREKELFNHLKRVFETIEECILSVKIEIVYGDEHVETITFVDLLVIGEKCSMIDFIYKNHVNNILEKLEKAFDNNVLNTANFDKFHLETVCNAMIVNLYQLYHEALIIYIELATMDLELIPEITKENIVSKLNVK